jgi:branched-chain amino acid transport system permease protein
MPRWVGVGLLAGLIVIYLTAVGMLASFETKAIISGVLNFSVFLMLATYLMAGYMVSRPAKGTTEAPNPRVVAPAAGAIGGALVGVFVIAMTLLADAGYNPRDMFVSITPAALDILSFGQSAYLGLLVQAAFGAVAGLAGGFLYAASPGVRSVVTTATSAILIGGLGAPLFIVMMTGLGLPTRWLFQNDGLTIIGSIVVVALTLGIQRYLRRTGGMRKAIVQLPGVTQRNSNMVIWAVTGVALAILPWIVNTFVSDVLGSIGLYILLGLGLNIVVGYAGLLDLGYVAFFAVGAYSIAILTARSSYLVGADVTNLAEAGLMSFWVALPITIVIAVIIGVLIGAPVLRLRGDYLAIVTLGFGEIIRTMVLSDWLKPIFGGPQGITEIPAVPLGPFNTRDSRILYYLIALFVVMAYFVSTRLKYARIGRAWAAMREDEDVAEGMGISVVRYKILAFVMGAAVGCLGGAFFAAKLSVANPGSFTFFVSINVLAVVVLGGMGSIPGVVVGSIVLVGLPELLREFGEYRLHIYGIIIVAIMILKPEGLLPDVRRARELRGEKAAVSREAHVLAESGALE